MISGLLLFLSLFLPRAFASVPVTTTADFANPSLLTLADFQETFQEEGYWSVDAQNTGAARVLSVDQIFTDSALDETVYLKLGLHQFADGTFNKVARGFAYQGETRDGSPYVLFFENIDFVKARALVARLEHPSSSSTASAAAHSARASVAALKLFIPRARAECGTRPLQDTSTSALKDLDGILGFRALATCAVTAFEAAGKTVASPFEALAQLVRDPAKFWDSTQKDWQKLKIFVLNARSELSKFFKEMGNLTPEVAEQIGCSVIGEVAGAVALGVVTGAVAGAAAAKTSAALVLLLSKLNNLKLVFRAISAAKDFAKLKFAGLLTKQVVSCATH